ncbi:protein of unknown function [Paenibacillus alvei]|uniref:Uncharacterized protein n=1 Tax=Paenibacillus alvei TaxID=44250 RepID=A0A383R3S9_PAEAL|nr:protein of unknown function [Paenibacillus alvei]
MADSLHKTREAETKAGYIRFLGIQLLL